LITVRILVSEKMIRWVRESRPFSLIQEEPTPTGWLLTLHVQHEDEMLQWILGWGQHVQVLEPESLRQKWIHEIEQMLKNAKGY
jgi:predicted DNA-binding transcriptional regulator YafY